MARGANKAKGKARPLPPPPAAVKIAPFWGQEGMRQRREAEARRSNAAHALGEGASQATRSEAALELMRCAGWLGAPFGVGSDKLSDSESRAMRKAAARGFDPKVRAKVRSEGGDEVWCTAAAALLSNADAKLSEAAWAALPSGPGKEDARAFLAIGGLGSPAPLGWPRARREALLGALRERCEPVAFLGELARLIERDESGGEWSAQESWSPEPPAPWFLGAGLSGVGALQALSPDPRRAGLRAAQALAEFGHELSDPERCALGRLARACAPWTEAERARLRVWTARAALDAEAEAKLGALAGQGLLEPIDALALSRLALRTIPSVHEASRREKEPEPWAAHPAWLTWAGWRGRGADAQERFERILALPLARPCPEPPSWAAVGVLQDPPSGLENAGAARAWMRLRSERGEPPSPEEFDGSPRRSSYPASLCAKPMDAFSRERFVDFARWAYARGWGDREWVSSGGTRKSTLLELSRTWEPAFAEVEGLELARAGAAASGAAPAARRPRL